MLARRLALPIALIAGLIGSQAPEFAQQYSQRLGGAVQELKRIVAEFDAEVAQEKVTPAEGVDRLEHNPTPWPANAARTWRKQSPGRAGSRRNCGRSIPLTP